MTPTAPNPAGYVISAVAGERVRAYVPPPLPLEAKALRLDSLQPLLAEANQALGRLDGLTSALPDLNLFLYAYVRKEAVLSSQIEGTQSSLSDLLLHENAQVPGVPVEDVEEVSRYVAALNHGMKRLTEGFPISLRLIREIHGVLLAKGRGRHAQPGEFRVSQNWIGGTRPGNAAFVPPPPEYVMDCMGALERFIHEGDSQLPLLVKAGLVHAQFETIHPFLDGNGRVGRLLITFMLAASGALRAPALYLSLYFRRHRQLYYERLNWTREGEGWAEWLDFFLQGVRDTAKQGAKTASAIHELFEGDKQKLEQLSRSATTALRVYEYAQRHPLFSIGSAAKSIGITFPATAGAVKRLIELSILREMSGRKRGRVFAYVGYMELLERE